ncbi:MAG TPA: hypothetical protein VG435_01565 [Acidimicrobiales bacterium]|nr:hypothetical protein [Acidimicrobiales bacterium]
MDKQTFTTGDWWLVQPTLEEPAPRLRVELGQAFGWYEQDWYVAEPKLSELYDFLYNNGGTLTADLDLLNSDEERQRWLRSAAATKAPPVVDTKERTDTERSETKDPLPPTEVVAEKPPVPTNEPPKKPGGLFAKNPNKIKAIDRARVSIEECTAVEKVLFEGALEATSLDAAVKRIYSNMHHNTGWVYRAGVTSTDGKALLDGASNQGMCATYRNAFNLAVSAFDSLRKAVGGESLQGGELKIESDDSLNGKHFVTGTGLTLMGGLRGNVYIEVDGKGAILARGDKEINKFVFTNHWSSRVNDTYFDPIFELTEPPEITTLTAQKVDPDGGRYLANRHRQTPDEEFSSTYIYVSEWPAFEKTVSDMRKLYTENKEEVDGILAGKLKLQTDKSPKTPRPVWTTATQMVKTRVSNLTIFERVVDETKDTVFRASDADAVAKIIALGTKTSS